MFKKYCNFAKVIRWSDSKRGPNFSTVKNRKAVNFVRGKTKKHHTWFA